MGSITGKTKVIGIFGYPVEHSFSPVMHNRAFDLLGLDCCYVPFPVKPEELEAATAAIRALGLAGVNVTIPHKERVMPFLDEISKEAGIIGAVNTIVNDNGRLIGYNTDGQGFLQSMRVEAGTDPAGKKVTLIGAGGAARSVAVQLALAGAREMALFDIVAERPQSIQKVISENTSCTAYAATLESGTLKEHLANTDILINATPIGMYPKAEVPPVVAPELISAAMLVCDLVYNPLETTLIRVAGEKGAKTLPGLGMLVYQGALAFKLWTGQEPPVDQMREAIIDYLGLG